MYITEKSMTNFVKFILWTTNQAADSLVDTNTPLGMLDIEWSLKTVHILLLLPDVYGIQYIP